MKPLLAVNADLENLRYPLLLSPKLDGVRCLVVDGVAMSRNMKPIPNEFVQFCLGHLQLSGLDGELVVGDPCAPNCFNATQSGVMRREGEPDFAFYVFDDFSLEVGFKSRLNVATQAALKSTRLRPVDHHKVHHRLELDQLEQYYVERGFEGVMLRDPEGRYKQGRSTYKEGILMKVKRFEDSEATVVEMLPLMRNENEQTRDELGRAKRSKKKAGLVQEEMLGKLLVKDVKTGVEFEIGTGFTEEQRIRFWRDGVRPGAYVSYKYQPAGQKDKPRFPVFKGFRHPEDV